MASTGAIETHPHATAHGMPALKYRYNVPVGLLGGQGTRTGPRQSGWPGGPGKRLDPRMNPIRPVEPLSGDTQHHLRSLT